LEKKLDRRLKEPGFELTKPHTASFTGVLNTTNKKFELTLLEFTSE
jgi:hypothetical protein